MKSYHLRFASLLALLLWCSGSTWAAPSLPVRKPPVVPLPSNTGPGVDPHAVSGQWFKVIGSEVRTVRSHEFHDNVSGDGGGAQGHLAIAGAVVNVVYGAPSPGGAAIVAFDIDAVVINDTPGVGPWLNGTNSHHELQTANLQATGTLRRAILTADFAVASPSVTVPPGDPTYRYAFPFIVATNMDVLGWYCWTGTGDFFVPGWSLGDIAPGQSRTQRMQFVMSSELPPTDERYPVIQDSFLTGTDILLNRTVSLKISNWIDDPGVDSGMPYPEPPLLASDVSVFHDVTEPGTNPPPEEPGLCVKWAQPPDCEAGLDLSSYGWSDEQMYYPVVTVADDWLCDGRPITGLRWWGSYIGYASFNPAPDIPPPVMPRPVAFLVSWYRDIPAQPPEEPYSRPGEIMGRAVYPTQLDSGQPVSKGVVLERTYCVSHLDYIEPGMVEHEYEYEVEFPATNLWNEKEGEIYWLSVQAVYTGTPPDLYRWGWKTTPPTHNWNDDAVQIDGPATNELVYPPLFDWPAATNSPYKGQSINMAFELLTDVCPRRAKKWVQPPDMETGENMPSFMVQGGEPLGRPLRADDWLCDGRRVTDIHWWGSYLGYRTMEPGPVPPPTYVDYRPLGFWLSWHTDVPADGGPSHPGILLTNLFVPLSKCHEVYYGPVEQSWKEPTQYEHEFQYYVDLLNPEVGAPWMETNGVVYWLNVQAVFPAGFEQGIISPDMHEGWGWKSTPPSNRWNDASAVTSNGQPWQVGVYPPKHPYEGLPCDLAFELTTDEVGGGTNWWNTPIVIRAIAKPAGAGTTVGSVGDEGAGVQVLQATTNLVSSNWVALITNALPLAAPHTNLWLDIPAAETTKYYRIMQK